MIDYFGKELNKKDRVIYITKSTGKSASRSPFNRGVIKSINEKNVTIFCGCLSKCESCSEFISPKWGCDWCQETITIPPKYIIKEVNNANL